MGEVKAGKYPYLTYTYHLLGFLENGFKDIVKKLI